MDRKAKLRLIYRWTHRDFKGRMGGALLGAPTILVYRNGTTLIPLDDMTDEEIADRLPAAMKKEAERKAKKAAAMKEAA